MKGRIFGIVLLLLCFGLPAFTVSAVEKPTRNERVQDVCFVRVRGAPQVPPGREREGGYSAFLLHYENLMRPPPNQEWAPQTVDVVFSLGPSEEFITFYPSPGDRENIILEPAPTGETMDFWIWVKWGGKQLAYISGSVVIPPA